ncbi:YdbL family protein [Sphingomonas sp. MMS24-J45]|uniref:YdbL family protein n=1 Tax=Sphingomonas sp. MMS24-J45 TaxID=3238806 RepID=UPI00384D2D95
MTRTFKISLAAFALIGASTAALAQRDPAYQAARSAGQVGEKPDGYLGVVGAGSAELRAMVNNINIQRKAAYTQQSAQAGSTVEQFAITSGCNLIARTVPGEKYQAPDGSWKTRTNAPPERIASCV